MTESPVLLPPLDDERVSAIETRLFRALAVQRQARALRRRRAVAISGVAAGLLALAVVVGPLVSVNGITTGASDSAAVAPEPAGGGEVGSGGAGVDPATGGSEQSAPFVPGRADGPPADGAVEATTREIVSTAAATLRTGSVDEAIRTLSAGASALGGYVERSSTSDQVVQGATDAEASAVEDGSVGLPYPQPLPDGAGSITIRVPSDRLAEARDSLDSLGTVTASTLDQQDVTLEAVDLRARSEAASASVDRLTQLIAQAGSLADLLAAESALTERQGELESIEQQLTALENRVALASLTVTVLPEEAVTSADPAGFLDGLATGWSGLVAAGNAALIGIGFLLPWLVVAALVAAVVLAIRRRRTPPPPGAPDELG
ncbi:DUF4349 domain-containing protein [Rathayibacter sp. ZW T2_19]|uniref:DUF4349 domain-containing protein n=1 Tax=Rathayibacter rubneri TaxID=2950106 RepID=A0A9X2IUA7_9MICO|nr:DUF4349 domain-containing protein [Rathayibacter rubneri]MCM6762479.1 DUF4349 domain-containing protein [Rathayibacter rubneri]